MKPTLTKHPEYNYRSLQVKFANGEPMTCDELNFLAWHEKQLSNERLDPISRYYLKKYHQLRSNEHSFLLPHEILNMEDIEKLKKRLQILVSPKKAHVQFSMTPAQFMQLKTIAHAELIMYHGAPIPRGTPFYHVGIPHVIFHRGMAHVIFFQLVNLFFVAKYALVSNKNALSTNVLMYVESMEDRSLLECVEDYTLSYHKEMEVEQKYTQTMHMQPPIHVTAPAPAHSPFKLPRLSLSRDQSERKEDN